ncbi:hypothetical protein [Bradyrhizobium sp. USDA 3458]|uniref:hypothetical protein n=1 Tax=Bradyrhizobium sp. USDA 3458 TaxID=2591461 RepID=UPI0013306CD3|nr:hypothetical protein [Bradyrhizobium sp. USDA 3458]
MSVASRSPNGRSRRCRRADPIHFEEESAFATREEAEWEVFRRRWQAVTGENLDATSQD